MKLLFVIFGLIPSLAFAVPVSLKGSNAAVQQAKNEAIRHDYTFVRNISQLNHFIDKGRLVELGGSKFYQVDKNVSFPFVRPETRLFVQQVSEQSEFVGCVRAIVVTSGTRPIDSQPRNAHRDSVHPTGMAVDLKKITHRRCRDWLEKVLLLMEENGVVQATLESKPPHYHVVVYSEQYAEHIASMGQKDLLEYTIQPGDSLYGIASRFGTSVKELQLINGLESRTLIHPGQVILLR